MTFIVPDNTTAAQSKQRRYRQRPLPAILAVVLGVLFVAGTLFAWKATRAIEKSASLSSTIEAKDTFTTRLGNLSKDASVSIRIKTSGSIAVWLVDQEDFSSFPVTRNPLFTGRAVDTLTFQLRVPAAGNYYLVLDNRKEDKKKTFTLDVTARADAAGIESKLNQASQELEKFESNLRQFFIFDNLTFKIASCGTANAYSKENTVVLCIEIGPKMLQMGNQQEARNVLSFTMLHEISHVLLRQWGYPFYDNEELVDEFTTALLVMFNQGERARSAAEYFSTLSPDKELELKRNKDDRHPLSVQRARNITHWLDDPELVRRWQKIFIPHMQTTVLESLDKNPKTWTDRKLVEQELASRS
jgi:hypothetical protein